MLPMFTRVRILAVPAFDPYRVNEVVDIVLANIDLLLAATEQAPRPDEKSRCLSYRAHFYRRPFKDLVAHVTVPLTAVIRGESPNAIPLTTQVLERLQELRERAVKFVASNVADESFVERVIRAVHDFGFFCRQHSRTIAGLHEEHLRDVLLIVMKHLFTGEGEAIHHLGKTDMKVTNPLNRYEFVVIELKIWRERRSVEELQRQLFTSHVTGQEALLVAQLFSSNKDFSAVERQVVEMFERHPGSGGPLERSVYEKSPEVMFRGQTQARSGTVPLVLSIVDIGMDM